MLFCEYHCHFMRHVFIMAAAVSYFSTSLAYADAIDIRKPNIIFVLCDDLGYGDIQCLNPQRGKILTPGVDRLASEGMVFTDAHSGSSVCTPTRYGLLTGRYSWRTKLQKGVVKGYDDNLIAKGRTTVADFLKAQGYHTGIIGKWHLNFNYTDKQTGEKLTPSKTVKLAPVGSKIPDGPIARGFDYFHGFHHARSMKVVSEDDVVIAHDEEINMLPRITQKSVEYIQARGIDKKPFFLYVPYGSPHTPILPNKQWQGKSGINPYADFVMETDDGFKQILEALDKSGLTEDTIVIFSADNGCSKEANIQELIEKKHYPSAHLRGFKSDLWEGGHRVPFIVRWPPHIQAGTSSDQLICLTDFIATCADITQVTLPENSAEDSVSFLPALKGEPIVTTRKGIIHHSISGHFSYRQGKWKLLLAHGSGGWTAPNEKVAKSQSHTPAQLYDLETDPSEKKNLYASHPDIVAKLLIQLESDVKNGRSTAGVPATNDVASIDLWKSKVDSKERRPNKTNKTKKKAKE